MREIPTLWAASSRVTARPGYLGGKLAFRYGVRVAGEDTQAEGFTTTPPR
ncbi:hypothetical protein [Nonomuraea sp. NPDC049758]